MFSPAALSTLQDEHVRVLSEQNKQMLTMLETEVGISQSWENVWLKPCFFFPAEGSPGICPFKVKLDFK